MPSMYENYESIQTTKPEHIILDTLASLGISYELFSNTSPKIARKIGDAVLKAIASELHPDRGSEFLEINGVSIQDINIARAMISDESVDIFLEAQSGDYKKIELLRQSEELMYAKNELNNQRVIGGALLAELAEEISHSEVQKNCKGVVLTVPRMENTVRYTKEEEIEQDTQHVNQIVRFDANGVVVDVSDFYIADKEARLQLVKKIDQLAAAEIVRRFSGLETNDLSAMQFMIIDGLLYYSKPYESYISTGIVFKPDTKDGKAEIKSLDGILLNLAFAKPKNGVKENKNIVTPVFKYNDKEEAVDSTKLVGSKFIGYYYFNRNISTHSDGENRLKRKALKRVNQVINDSRITELTIEEMKSLQSNASYVSTDINNNNASRVTHDGQALTVFAKIEKKSKKLKFYLTPAPFKVLQPEISEG